MVWLLIFWIVMAVTSVWLEYVRAVDVVGREAARRNLSHSLYSMLYPLALMLLITLRKYDGVFLCFYIFLLLLLLRASVWLLTWFFCKRESGDLLINIGRTVINKYCFWGGVLFPLILISITWQLFFHLLGELFVHGLGGFSQSTSLENYLGALLFLVFSCGVPILLFALGLSRLEFRENGICFMFTFINWQKVNSYSWKLKPNQLTIWFKPDFPLFAGIMNIPIPTKHRDIVLIVIKLFNT